MNSAAAALNRPISDNVTSQAICLDADHQLLDLCISMDPGSPGRLLKLGDWDILNRTVRSRVVDQPPVRLLVVDGPG